MLISSQKWSQYKTEFVYLTSTLVLPELINWNDKGEDFSADSYPLQLTFQPDDVWTLYFCSIPLSFQPFRHFSQVFQLASRVLLAPLRSLRLPHALLHPHRPRQQAFPPHSPRSARSSLPCALRRLQRLRGLRRKRSALSPRVFDLPPRVLQELRAPATLPEG